MLYRKVVFLSYLFSINLNKTNFKYLYLEASGFQPLWRHDKGSNYLFASNAYLLIARNIQSFHVSGMKEQNFFWCKGKSSMHRSLKSAVKKLVSLALPKILLRPCFNIGGRIIAVYYKCLEIVLHSVYCEKLSQNKGFVS